MGRNTTTDLDRARDELFSQIHRCGVLKAGTEQQEAWMRDTMGYLEELYPSLTPEDVAELTAMGMRFCQPAIPHGKGFTERTRGDWDAADGQGGEGDPEAV